MHCYKLYPRNIITLRLAEKKDILISYTWKMAHKEIVLHMPNNSHHSDSHWLQNSTKLSFPFNSWALSFQFFSKFVYFLGVYQQPLKHSKNGKIGRIFHFLLSYWQLYQKAWYFSGWITKQKAISMAFTRTYSKLSQFESWKLFAY